MHRQDRHSGLRLLRPGRIDRKIEFPNPQQSSRFDILKIHSKKMNLMRGIDLKKIADKMVGSVHREGVLHEADIFALRERRSTSCRRTPEMAC